MNIGALRSGSVKVITDKPEGEFGEIKFDEIEFDAVEPDAPLSDAVRKKIVKDFKASKEEKLSECQIAEYYGTYAGFIIVEIYYRMKGINTVTVMRKLTAADIYLGAISMDGELLAWRENER